MKFFIIEGNLKTTENIDDEIMKEHIAYSKKAMDEGLILMSGLKTNMSGGLFIMKAQSIDIVEKYLLSEPFKVHGIQDYKITEFSPHYVNKTITECLNA